MSTIETLSLAITIGAVALALICIFIALRATGRGGDAGRAWKSKYDQITQKLSDSDAVFGAYPGLILVWEGKLPETAEDWGSPKIYGSTAALASVVRFVEAGKSKDLPTRLLNGLADLDTLGPAHEARTLRHHLKALSDTGQSFSISISLPEGELINANGRVGGRQIVLWLEDESVRGEDERQAISRLKHSKSLAHSDPVAFIDMMNRAPFPVWRASSAGNLTWVNDAYVEAVGAKDAKSVINDQITLDDETVEQCQKTLAKHEPVEHTRFIVLSGQRKSTSVLTFPVTGGVAGIAVDKSETEGLRQALTRHIRAHDEMLNHMDEGIAIFGADQRMSFHNTAFADAFKLDTGWFKTRPSHSEWLDHLREKQLLPMQADYHSWKAYELEIYTDIERETPDQIWAMPDGRTLRVAFMRDPHGGISLLFSDITSHVALQGQFNTLINVQKATLDKLSEGIAVFGTDGRLKISNAAFASLWNLPEDLLAQTPLFSDIIEICLPLFHDKVFWRELKARTTDPNPEVRRQVDGEIRRSDDSMLTWLSRPLPDGATLIAWNDVTSSRKAEAALIERAEALEAADRIKSEFVGHVSYQLRTPLTTISGYADFLQNSGAGELNDKQSEYIFAIQSASEELAKTINDILDITAIEANVLDLELGDVDVYDLLYGTLDYVATKADDTKKTLNLNCDPDIGVIRADEKRLKQVAYNLLLNALRFTKPGGNIELGGARADGGGVMIWVKDDGVGIPSERQPQVFESFKSSRGGAGLGLALVQRFVECHGGWVELESEEDQGTHITCYIPKDAVVTTAHPELQLIT